MKLFLDYKKLCSIFVFFAVFIVPVFFSHAESMQELQNKINQKDSDIAKLEDEIEAYQGQLSTLGQQKGSLGRSIQELDITKKKLQTDIAVTQKKIDKSNLTIQSLSFDIGGKEKIIANQKNSILLELRKTDELERIGIIETILSEKDFTAIWNDIDNMGTVREKIIKHIGELKQVKGELEDTRTVSIKAKNELIALKSKLSDQQKIVVQNTNEKNKLLQQTKNSESAYQKLLKDQLAKKAVFEKELRDYEAQLQFISDPSKLPKGGVLSWPLDKIFVTQEFGAKTGPHRTYASGHSGTDFRARTPLPVYSMADGVIKGVGDTDTICPGVSFGKWILIEYNNGLSSTFGHLSLIKVREGQKVKRGEEVGYTGGTGRVTGPHLHISLYASSGVSVLTVPSKSCPGKILKQPIAPINAYVDPMYFMPPYIPSA